ncbi:MAG: RluA family pseudouridine synthase [Acidobacteria bacterium]|nr:RluA family pseudouridine synthase [Acidobacteriota bacterium]
MRLDLALIGLHPTLSRRRARAAIEKGQVTVDGTRVREAGHPVPDGAAVVWDPHRKALPRARCSLPILHEDEHVLVIDKPAGLLTVPSGPGQRDEDTALARVRDYVARLRPREAFAERVHRLDRNTTGALAFALSREARAGLIQIFRAHRIERRYLAIVEGEPPADQGVVDAPLRDEWVSGRRAVAHPSEPGKAARTRWRVRERFAGAALLEVDLDTGRQHQIRVHLAHVGLPVLGDRVYGRGTPGRTTPRRPMLHARRLAFAHPISGARVAVESPLPADFTRVLARLRRQGTGGGAPRRSKPSPPGDRREGRRRRGGAARRG